MSSSKQNPTVAIVAPSGYAQEPADLMRAEARLRDAGCIVRALCCDADRYQRFGANDAGRAAQIHAAAADPAVDIVLALRGGYGLSRLLPLLDLPMLARSGKLFVGHSDFTVLNMGLLVHGAASFAGPMICADFAREEPSAMTLDDFWHCLRGSQHAVDFTSCAHAPLDVSGTLWGGNLTMLAHLVGTPYMPHIERGILFIEDVNEHPYRIERMLLQMHHAGLLKQQVIVFGDFSGYRLADYDNGYDFEAMLDFLRSRFDVPLLTGLPFGHVRDKVTLPVGSQARLQSDGANCRLVMSGYPTLSQVRSG